MTALVIMDRLRFVTLDRVSITCMREGTAPDATASVQLNHLSSDIDLSHGFYPPSTVLVATPVK